MYKHIMVPLDGLELAECVLPHVETVARGCGVKSGFSPEERQRLEAGTINIARSYLDRVVERLKQNGVIAKAEVLYGKVVDEIADYVSKNEIDLIVVSTHGHSGITRWVWGNAADRILRSVCAPVLMVRAPGCFPVSKS